MVNWFPGALALFFLSQSSPPATGGPGPDAVAWADADRRVKVLEAVVDSLEPALSVGAPGSLSEAQATRFAAAWNEVLKGVDPIAQAHARNDDRAVTARVFLPLPLPERLCQSAGGSTGRECPTGPRVKALAATLAYNMLQTRQRETELEAIRGLYELKAMGGAFAPVACPDGSRAPAPGDATAGGCHFVYRVEEGDALPKEGSPWVATASGVAAPVKGVQYKLTLDEKGERLERVAGRQPKLLALPGAKAPDDFQMSGQQVYPAPAALTTVGSAYTFGEGMTRPRPLSGQSPVYTREALQAKVQGMLIVRCLIGTDGYVYHCRIVKPLPFMEAATLHSLYTRRYEPVTYEGKPVACDYVFNIKMVIPPP